MFFDCLQSSPREIMRSLFAINGIKVDPQHVNYVVDMVITKCELGYGNGVDKYDCFLSYRVDKNREIVKEIYWQLKFKGFHPFLDSECLFLGENWKEGFLMGLRNSRIFVPIISRAALERPRRFDVDHRNDSVLIEYETALRMKGIIGKSNFIVPLLVGEYVHDQGKSALYKFDDFSPSLYSPSILPIAGAASPSTAVSASSNVTSTPSGNQSAVDHSLQLDKAWSLLTDPKRHGPQGAGGAVQNLLEELDVENAEDLKYLKETSVRQLAAMLKEASSGKFLIFMNVEQ